MGGGDRRSEQALQRRRRIGEPRRRADDNPPRGAAVVDEHAHPPVGADRRPHVHPARRGAGHRQDPRARGIGPGEHHRAVVDRVDLRAPPGRTSGEVEQAVGVAGIAVQVDAVDPGAGGVEQRVGEPQRRGRRVAHPAAPVAGHRPHLVDAELQALPVREGHRAQRAAQDVAPGARREQMGDRREGRRGRVGDARLQGVGVGVEDADPARRGGERGERRQPGRAQRVGAGDRGAAGERTQGAPEAGEEVADVVAGGSREHRRPDMVAIPGDPHAVAHPVPRRPRVEAGLVADDERLQPAAADPPQQLVRLVAADPRRTGLEVDADDQVRVQGPGQRARVTGPGRRERAGDPRRGRHPAHRPPRPVGALPADAQHRAPGRGEVAHERHQHRVHVAGRDGGAGPARDRRVLQRQADESARAPGAHRRGAHDHPQRPGRPGARHGDDRRGDDGGRGGRHHGGGGEAGAGHRAAS